MIQRVHVFRLLLVGVVACGETASSTSPAGGGAGQTEQNGRNGDRIGESAANSGAAGTPECVTIATTAPAALPHVRASGASVNAVARALDAIVAAQTPPRPAATSSYTMSSIGCRTLWTPVATSGYGCELDVAIDGGNSNSIDLEAPSDLAHQLFDALKAAGAGMCDDPAHGAFVRAENVKLDVAAATLDLDDIANDRLPPKPNVVVTDEVATNVVAALRSAGIDDCDAAGTLYLVCNTMSGAPTCGYTKQWVEDVGGSRLVPACRPHSPVSSGQLDGASSRPVWDAILAAAKRADVKPLNGTIADATVINASSFGWEGKSLGFTLVVDNATPPPGPSETP